MKLLNIIQNRNFDLRKKGVEHVEDTYEMLQISLAEISAFNDLSEDAENRILQIGEQAVLKENDLFSKGLKFEEYCTQVVNVLDNVMKKSKKLGNQEMEALLLTLNLKKLESFHVNVDD